VVLRDRDIMVLLKQNQTSLIHLSEVILCREAHDSFHTRVCIVASADPILT
jgi:hypothetical protein